MQLSKLCSILFIFNIHISQAMEAPLQQGQVIAALKDLEIRLTILNTKKNENLLIDSVSPFDITPTTLTRKNLGTVNNGILSLNGNEKLEFDSEDNKKAVVSALHIYPEDKKTEGLALKLSYNQSTRNFDFHLDQLKNTTLSRIITKTINLKKPTSPRIASLVLDLEVNPTNWAASTFDILQNQAIKPTQPSAGKSPSKNLKFWQKK